MCQLRLLCGHSASPEHPHAVQLVWELVLEAWLAAFCTWVTGGLFLASSARDALAKHWAHHCQAIGHSLSAIGSYLLVPDLEQGASKDRCPQADHTLATSCCCAATGSCLPDAHARASSKCSLRERLCPAQPPTAP